MPLQVPGVTIPLSKDPNDQNAEWQSKLLGKKLGESSDTVTFAKRDLPQEHRVVGPGDMATMDFKPERLTVHVDEQGIVTKVAQG